MNRRRVVLAVGLVVALLCGVGYYFLANSNDREATIGKNGGSLSRGPVTVRVAPGAVTKKTELSVGDVKSQRPSDLATPLSRVVARVLRFDVALDGGKTQPRAGGVSLEVRLEGTELDKSPVGTLFLYTRGPSGYELVNSTVSKGVLRATLSHLSPWWVTSLDPNKLASEASSLTTNSGGTGKSRPTDKCAKRVKIGSTKVRLGTPQRWTDRSDSSMHPCLAVADGKVVLRVLNNSYPYWAVNVSDGIAVATPYEGIDPEVVRGLSRVLFPRSGVKTYLARDGVLNAAFSPDDLPVKLWLNADFNTFAAEATIIAADMLLTLYGVDDTDEMVKKVLRATSVLKCIEDSTKAARSDNLVDFTVEMFQVLSGDCSTQVLELLGSAAGDLNPLKGLIKRLEVLGAVRDAGKLLVTAFDNAKRQLDGEVEIGVEEDVDPLVLFLRDRVNRTVWASESQSAIALDYPTGEIEYMDFPACDDPRWLPGESCTDGYQIRGEPSVKVRLRLSVRDGKAYATVTGSNTPRVTRGTSFELRFDQGGRRVRLSMPRVQWEPLSIFGCNTKRVPYIDQISPWGNCIK